MTYNINLRFSNHIYNIEIDLISVYLACSWNTPMSLFKRLAKNPRTRVRHAVVTNHRIPREILAEFEDENKFSVLYNLVRRRFAPMSVLDKYSVCDIPEIRIGIINNPSVTEEIYMKCKAAHFSHYHKEYVPK